MSDIDLVLVDKVTLRCYQDHLESALNEATEEDIPKVIATIAAVLSLLMDEVIGEIEPREWPADPGLPVSPKSGFYQHLSNNLKVIL